MYTFISFSFYGPWKLNHEKSTIRKMGVKIVFKPRGAYSRAYPSFSSIKHLEEWLLFLDRIQSIAGYPIFSSPNILVDFLGSLLGPNHTTGSYLSVFPKMQCNDHQ